MPKRKLIAIQHCGEVGGSGIGLLSVLNILREQFYIVVYCVSTPRNLVELYEEKGYCVKPVKHIPTFTFHSGGPSVISIDFLIPLLRIKKVKKEWEGIFQEEEPDIVLANSMVLCWMWEAIQTCKAKAICYVREVLPNRWDPRARRILRDLEHFDAIWFISEHEKSYFNLKHPESAVIRDCTVEVAPSTEDADSARMRDGKFHVLYVGGLSKLKGLDTLVKSLRFLDHRVVLDIAGYLPENGKFKRHKFERLSLLKNAVLMMSEWNKRKMYHALENALEKYPNRIILQGHHKNTDALYQDCDALVFPSRAPHQSRPAFEVGFFMKPVVISDFKQTKENVRHMFNGLTFKPKNPKALADAINALCHDRSLCRRLGENNRKNSMEKHTFEAVQSEMRLFWQRFCT